MAMNRVPHWFQKELLSFPGRVREKFLIEITITLGLDGWIQVCQNEEKGTVSLIKGNLLSRMFPFLLLIKTRHVIWESSFLPLPRVNWHIKSKTPKDRAMSNGNRI